MSLYCIIEIWILLFKYDKNVDGLLDEQELNKYFNTEFMREFKNIEMDKIFIDEISAEIDKQEQEKKI